MRSAVALTFLLASAPIPSSASSQTADPARVRAVYDQVVALRSEYERTLGRFATVNGIKIHYLEWGEPRGFPLIWAHGSASTAYEIRGVAPRLVEAGYRVIAVDYRGHGLTRVTDFEFSIQHVADDLVALLDHLEIRSAVFGGASKGGFIAAAVYELHPERVAGLLMADGGTWSNQWLFDHAESEEALRRLTQSDPPPRITRASEFEVFQEMVGKQIPATGDVPAERLLDLLVRIGPQSDGTWAFLPGFEQMMGSLETYTKATTRPTTLPMLQWSQHAMIPPAVFRNLDVPMMILDPQENNDALPVTDQNEHLARQHSDLIVHRIYPESGHNLLRARPDWFVRDAIELLDRVRKMPARR